MNERVEWRLSATLKSLFIFPIKHIINHIKLLCFQYGVNVEVLKSGIINKEIKFLISGKTGLKDRIAFEKALNDYFKEINGKRSGF